jgi:ABC-type antimicrobial peptide transport system permease subunit
MELYAERVGTLGKIGADWRFILDVLLLFRPGIIRPTGGIGNMRPLDMYKSYFKIGWRNLIRNRGYSVINVVGLSVGIGVTMLIGMWVADEITYNRGHKNYDRIAQVYQHQTFNNEISTLPSAPTPLYSELKTTYKDDFKRVVRMWWVGSHVLSVEGERVAREGTFMDPEALEMFSFEMLRGDRNSLSDPSSILLSESAARALFGSDDPVNRMIRLDNMVDVMVTGVFKQFPDNSRFHSLQFVSTWDFWVASNNWMKADENNWGSSINVFVELQPDLSFDVVSSKIRDIRYNNLNKEQASLENPQLFLQPMSRWHLHSNWNNGVESGGRIQFVWLFCIIAVFVLLLACINFMNLSTAQSERRSREVGIRKSIGSFRSQLIFQFLTESFLVVVFSFLLGIVIVGASLPWFNDLSDKTMDLPWANPYFWLISVAFIMITSLLSGGYPALYLSGIGPLTALKGAFKANRFASLPREILVVLQFTVSIVLILGTIVVWKQIQYAKDRPIGYKREGLIMIRKTSPDYWGKLNAIRNELKASGAVLGVAESSSPATAAWFTNTGFAWKGKDPNSNDEFSTMAITFDYGKTVGWDFVMGRDYSTDFSTDSSAVILNEAAVRFMGLENPINEEITWRDKKFTVIGVIKDMIMDSPYQPAKQTIFWLNYEDEGKVWINIKMNPVMSASDALVKIEGVFQKLIPSVPFDFKFVDQEYAMKFRNEVNVSRLSGLFSFLAIFISCLGLFGMASFVAEMRKKEIGVRKILGASVIGLWRMLSIEFLILVGISCSIGIPMATYLINQWLSKYQYRTEVSWWIFAVVIIGAMAITLLTVSFQTVKAAMGNPVKSLRSE